MVWPWLSLLTTVPRLVILIEPLGARGADRLPCRALHLGQLVICCSCFSQHVTQASLGLAPTAGLAYSPPHHTPSSLIETLCEDYQLSLEFPLRMVWLDLAVLFVYCGFWGLNLGPRICVALCCRRSHPQPLACLYKPLQGLCGR